MIDIALRISGLLLIGLAILHVIFPRHFQWKQELKSLNLINRQMMEVHTFFIALTVLLMGLLCLVLPDEIGVGRLGNGIGIGLAIFWFARLLTQFFWYSPALWKGKKFETFVHIAFSLLWAGLTTLFLWATISR